MAQQECKLNVSVKGEEKKKEKSQLLTKLMKYVKENNSTKFVEQLKMSQKQDFQRVLNKKINNTYLIVQAAKYNNLNIAKELAQQQHVNISLSDEHGKTALFWSCVNNNDKMCQYLMHHGADPNIVSLSSKSTPLIQAAYEGNLKIMKYLFNSEKKFLYSFDWVCHIITFAFIFIFIFFLTNQFCLQHLQHLYCAHIFCNRTNISIKRITMVILLFSFYVKMDI